MRFAKAILAAIAAVGVARLLAPRETQEFLDNAKRALQRSMTTARRKTAEMSEEMSDMAERAYPSVANHTKAAGRSATRKTSRARKAASRPRTHKATT
jgi:hypothetical protein